MSIVLPLFVAVLSATIVGDDGNRNTRDYWNEIQLLHESGESGSENTELEQHLRSLSAEEMIIAAQQACEKRAVYGVVLCFKHYIEKSENPQQGIRRLMTIVSDASEHLALRRALIQMMSTSPFNRFVEELQSYMNTHVEEVHAILTKIVENPREQAVLRDAALSTIAEWLRERMIKAYASDPNLRKVKDRTHKIVPVGKMVRAGELTLAETTWEQLKPIEERILSNAMVLRSVIADEDATESLRARAKFMLELYKTLPLTEDGCASVDRALRAADR